MRRALSRRRRLPALGARSGTDVPFEREGTRGLIEAARKQGVRRIVYTSSVATMGFSSNGTLADENSPVSLAI